MFLRVKILLLSLQKLVGKQLLLDSQLNIANMAEPEAKYGVDDLEIVGNPHKSGNGSTVSPSTYIGITKNCKNTAAAWEFIALRISDKYKENYLTKRDRKSVV